MDLRQGETSPYAAVVWILAGISLTVYCTLGLLGKTIPGVEELVTALSEVEGTYLYIAAFAAIFTEGLYFVGSFFPGTTLVVILAILSQIGGTTVFVYTIVTIFVGWCLAGAVNILLAKMYHAQVVRLQVDHTYEVQDRLWVTWYPAFRATYEVAQVTEGGSPLKVFLSSVRVKFWASLAAAVGVLIIPFFVDIHEISNEEGFTTVALVAAISFMVGFIKLRKYFVALSQHGT